MFDSRLVTVLQHLADGTAKEIGSTLMGALGDASYEDSMSFVQEQ